MVVGKIGQHQKVKDEPKSEEKAGVTTSGPIEIGPSEKITGESAYAPLPPKVHLDPPKPRKEGIQLTLYQDKREKVAGSKFTLIPTSDLVLDRGFSQKFKPEGATMKADEAKILVKEMDGAIVEMNYGGKPVFLLFKKEEAIKLRDYANDHFIPLNIVFAD